jgi:hypothetical protein
MRFVRVNVLPSICLKRPLSRPGFHPWPRARGYQPLAGSVLVVSHHLDGLGSLQVLGLLRPSTEQDSLRFGLVEPSTRRPGLARAVPGSAFTPFEAFPSLAAVPHHYGRCLLDVRRSARLTLTSRPTRLSQRLARPTHRESEDPHPPAGGPPQLHRWSHSILDRRPSGPDAVTSARLPRSHVACLPQ